METDKGKYLFTTSRLGFRTWSEKDLKPMARLNKDHEVMKHFPGLPSEKETEDFINRMISLFKEHRYCYFPIEHLKTNKFIGFIGLSLQEFNTDFCPCIDIGWRLKKDFWGKGLATEGALECLKYAQTQLGLEQIYSMAPKSNKGSIQVMKKIGMHFIKEFEHPKLENHTNLRSCVLYGIDLS